MGNIMQTSFIEIWNGNILNRYRKNLLKGKVRDLNPAKHAMPMERFMVVNMLANGQKSTI